MANTLYPNFGSLMLGDAGASHALPDLSSPSGTGIISILLDTGTYTYSAAHEDIADLSGQVGSDVVLTSPTVAAGVWDAATPITHTSVSGNSIEAVVFAHDTGTDGTSPLIMYTDTDTGGAISITPNSGDIEVALGASIIDLIT
jgi:hypothetical protein